MDFIFMLTRADKTVEDCLEVFEEVAPLGLGHVGFKDIGVQQHVLVRLIEAIRRTGATTYMEVVSTSAEAALNSARMARELGVDRLLGGTLVRETLQILQGSRTRYYPFPGRPVGHPTRLGGRVYDVELDAEAFMTAGCGGCDLLAYRAFEAEPVDLIRAARRGLGSGYLIVAGSVTSRERIQEAAAAGADAFTIGTAVFDGSYSPNHGSIRSQLRAVMGDAAADLASA